MTGWIQVLTILVGISGMFLWVRRESNQDSRELRNLIINLGNDMKKEARDFHGRLCSLEERMKGK